MYISKPTIIAIVICIAISTLSYYNGGGSSSDVTTQAERVALDLY